MSNRIPTTRIQAVGNDVNDLVDALYHAVERIEEGFSSGFLVDTYNFEPISRMTPPEDIFGTDRPTATVEIAETTSERVAFTLGIIAEQINDGFRSGSNFHDEGSYTFTTQGL